MRAAESRFFGWKLRDRGANPAVALARLLTALASIWLPLFAPRGQAFRHLTMIAVAAALIFAPLPAPFTAGAPEGPGFASLGDQSAAEHGHSHDDEEAADHSGLHKHGHDPADHSHQYAFLSGGSHWGLPPLQRWPSDISGRLDGALGLGIERPPKQAALI